MNTKKPWTLDREFHRWLKSRNQPWLALTDSVTMQDVSQLHIFFKGFWFELGLFFLLSLTSADRLTSLLSWAFCSRLAPRSVDGKNWVSHLRKCKQNFVRTIWKICETFGFALNALILLNYNTNIFSIWDMAIVQASCAEEHYCDSMHFVYKNKPWKRWSQSLCG